VTIQLMMPVAACVDQYPRSRRSPRVSHGFDFKRGLR
jgi:hypothetical protein